MTDLAELLTDCVVAGVVDLDELSAEDVAEIDVELGRVAVDELDDDWRHAFEDALEDVHHRRQADIAAEQAAAAAWLAEHAGSGLFGHELGNDGSAVEVVDEPAPVAEDDEDDDELDDDDFVGGDGFVAGCTWSDYADDPIRQETRAELAERLKWSRELRWFYR